MIHIVKEYNIGNDETLVLINVIKSIYMYYEYLIIDGFEVEKIGKRTLQVFEGNLISFDGNMCVVYEDGDNFTLDIDDYWYSDRKMNDGLYALVITRSGNSFNYQIINIESFNNQEYINTLYEKYAIVKIFEIVEDSIGNLYDHIGNLLITKPAWYLMLEDFLHGGGGGIPRPINGGGVEEN